MSPFIRPIPRLAPVVRSLAIASVLGTTFLVGSLGLAGAQAPAQQTPAQKPPAAAAATSNKPETVEQRITTLKTALKVTADQEAKWGAVAAAMRDNATAMDKLVQAKRATSPASMTAVDDLNTYQEFTQLRLDGLKNLNSAFKSFYNSMPAAQQKNADQVFMTYGTAPAQG